MTDVKVKGLGREVQYSGSSVKVGGVAREVQYTNVRVRIQSLAREVQEYGSRVRTLAIAREVQYATQAAGGGDLPPPDGVSLRKRAAQIIA